MARASRYQACAAVTAILLSLAEQAQGAPSSRNSQAPSSLPPTTADAREGANDPKSITKPNGAKENEGNPTKVTTKKKSITRVVTGVSTVPLQWDVLVSGGYGVLIPKGTSIRATQLDQGLHLQIRPFSKGSFHFGGMTGFHFIQGRFKNTGSLTSSLNAAFFDAGGFVVIGESKGLLLGAQYRHGLDGKQEVTAEGNKKNVSLVDLKAASVQAGFVWPVTKQFQLGTRLNVDFGSFQRLVSEQLYQFSYNSYSGILTLGWSFQTQ